MAMLRAALISVVVLILTSAFALPMTTVDEDIANLISGDRLDEAMNVLTLKVAGNDKDVPALSMLGELYRKKGDKNRSMKYLKKAISLDPAYSPARLYFGKLNYTMNELEVMNAEFCAYRDLMRKNIADAGERDDYLTGLHDISAIYMGMKMYDKFFDIVKEILALSPKDEAATYNMGMYYYVYEHNRPKAYEYFKAAAAIDPSSGVSAKAKYAIEYIRTNPDARVEGDFSFIEQEFRD